MENQKKILELALYAGEIMLKNGGETYRSEDVMKRLCTVCGIPKVDTFVTPTGMFLCIDDGKEDGHVYSFQRSIKYREINMMKVSAINDFSRKFSPEIMTMDEALEKLNAIDNQKSYPAIVKTLFSGLATAAFTIASGGQIKDGICGLFIGMIMFFFINQYSKIEKNDFIRTLIASALGAMIAIICNYEGFCSNIDYLIIGAIYILLPGIAITNAIRDSLSGDLLSGLVRVFEAFIISGSIAIGVGIVLDFFGMLSGGGF